MRVAVIGPESTGGRLVGRLVGAHPALEVRHWSLPHGYRDERRWPFHEASAFAPDAVLVTMRAWEPMLRSKVANHVRDELAAEQEAREAFVRLMAWLQPYRWRLVVYEALTASGSELDSVWDWLGMEAVPACEELHDADAKWYQAVVL